MVTVVSKGFEGGQAAVEQQILGALAGQVL